MNTIKKINLSDKFGQFSEQWSPKIVGKLNGQMVKIAKVQGDFVMHQHETEDEFFMVIEGKLFIALEEETLELNPGEFVIIPRGVNHKPFAPNETKIMLFEPASTLNTGDKRGDMTVENPENLME